MVDDIQQNLVILNLKISLLNIDCFCLLVYNTLDISNIPLNCLVHLTSIVPRIQLIVFLSFFLHYVTYEENAIQIMNTSRGFYLGVYVTCGATTAYHSGAQELILGFQRQRGSCCTIFSFPCNVVQIVVSYTEDKVVLNFHGKCFFCLTQGGVRQSTVTRSVTRQK